MGRKKHPEPFWRSERNCYFVQLGKKQHRLDPDEAEAWRLYHELMSRPPEAPKPPVAGPDMLVVQLLDRFLEWARNNKAARTFGWYRENIQPFVDALPEGLRVAELKAYHVTEALDAHPNWGNNTRHDFVSAVKRAFNWAADEELIDRSPLAKVKKPQREAREMAVSPEEYAHVVATVSEACFRDLIELAWETGARVQELRKFEARFVEHSKGRIVLPPSKAKGKKYHRVIYLTDRASEIVERLCKGNPAGPLLRNSQGTAWTKDSINCAFCRLQLALGRRAMDELGIAPKYPGRFKKTGLPPTKIAAARAAHRKRVQKWHQDELALARQHGKKYHLGAFRKGYTTEALKNGVDTVTLAHLLGHADPSMVSKVYAKVQQDPAFMAEAARRAKGSQGN